VTPDELHGSALYFELKTASIDFRIYDVERIVVAIGRAQVPVNSTVWEILTIFAQKRTFVDQFAARPAAMAVALASLSDGF
jgi:hypothetical protein